MKRLRDVLFLTLLVYTPSHADVDPTVRIEVEPGNVRVGQSVRLRVTVLGPTWFTSPPVYPSFEQVNAITRLPPNSSFPISERIGNETWSGVVRDYQVYPQAAGKYEFSDQTITLTYADPTTRKPIERSVPVPAISFSATVPEGAESLDPFLVSISVSLRQDLDGGTEQIGVGDAVVRTVAASIKDMPAMFLPPLMDIGAHDGISVYAKDAVLDETTESRSDRITGTRTESATYVFERSGTFALPAIELRWWNPQAEKIDSTSIPEISVSVAGNPVAESAKPDGELTGFDWKRWAAGVLLLVVVVVVVRVVAPVLQRRVTRWRERWRVSEGYAFRRVLADVARADRGEVYASILAWAGHAASAVELSDWMASNEVIARLASDVYGRGSSPPSLTAADRREIKSTVKELRQSAVDRRQPVDNVNVLPALNP